MYFSVKNILFGLSLMLIYWAAVGIRLHVLDRAAAAVGGGELPFTLESALHFRMQEISFFQGEIPKKDSRVQVPEGIHPHTTYTLGSEKIYDAMARMMPETWSLPKRFRISQILWFSLGAPALAVFIFLLTGSRWAGFLGGMIYAVSIASVIRSSGIELSRENFAFPLLIAHLCARTWAGKPHEPVVRRYGFLVSALLLGAALMTWDMIQFYLITWMLIEAFRDFFRPRVGTYTRTELALLSVVLLIVGLWNPYLRSHQFLLSLGMLLFYGRLVLAFWLPSVPTNPSPSTHAPSCVPECCFLLRAVLLLMPLVLGGVWAFHSGYGDAYSHFGELLAAKFQFLNQKPADPSLLTYEQRIMWVPALHSADWSLTRQLFPTTLILSVSAVVLLTASRPFRPGFDAILVVTFVSISLLFFILFVRFHVYLILFMSILIPLPLAAVMRRSFGWAAVLSIFLLGSLAVEASHVLQSPWGRNNVYYPELKGMTEYLSEHVAPEPVLANFGVSASILTYGRCPILLHPKFENPEIRNRVREYAETLFKGNELDFRNWAETQGARYYVHALGSYASVLPEYQMRYFVDALEPNEDTAAWVFETNPSHLRYFVMEFENRKYRVFRIITSEVEQRAGAWALQAADLLNEGRTVEAFHRAQDALGLFPYEPMALKIADRAQAVQ